MMKPAMTDARAMLDTVYAWLDRHMAGREWAVLPLPRCSWV